MSTPDPPGGQQAPAPAPFVSTPNAERYLLEADNLRRRQLRSALLHGSSRTWRDRRRIWPAVIAGLIVVAVISAAIGIYGTFQQQQREREQEERQRELEQRQRDLEQEQRQRELEQDQSLAEHPNLVVVVAASPGRAGGPVWCPPAAWSVWCPPAGGSVWSPAAGEGDWAT